MRQRILLFLKHLLSQSYSNIITRRRVKWIPEDLEFKPDGTELTAQQKRAIQDFYAPFQQKLPRYLRKTIEYYYAFYVARTGKFHVNYIPDSLYYCWVDPYFNNWKASKYLDNKTLYARLLPVAQQPETAAMRCNGLWTVNGQTVTEAEVLTSLAERPEVVVKIARESEGGHGVYFCCGSDSDKLHELFVGNKGDIIVQKPIVQHPELARINASSVNTIRILSLLGKDGVKIYSSVLRMGIGGSRVDNASSGGITCGVCEDGRLRERAYDAAGRPADVHPTSGLSFSELTVPCYRECCEFVKRLHPLLPWFRLISWDLTVDEQGQPVLIEINLHFGALDFHQLCNGPLFGADTKAILDEVFGSDNGRTKGVMP